MPRADKAVKCKEDGVTRFLRVTPFPYLCGELFEKLRYAVYLFRHLPDFLLIRKAQQFETKPPGILVSRRLCYYAIP